MLLVPKVVFIKENGKSTLYKLLIAVSGNEILFIVTTILSVNIPITLSFSQYNLF